MYKTGKLGCVNVEKNNKLEIRLQTKKHYENWKK